MIKMKCSNCKQDNTDGSKYCIKCGTPLSQNVQNAICPKCNTPNPKTAIFCMNCASRLNTLNDFTPSDEKRKEELRNEIQRLIEKERNIKPEKKKSKLKWIGIPLIIILFFSIAFSWYIVWFRSFDPNDSGLLSIESFEVNKNDVYTYYVTIRNKSNREIYITKDSFLVDWSIPVDKCTPERIKINPGSTGKVEIYTHGFMLDVISYDTAKTIAERSFRILVYGQDKNNNRYGNYYVGCKITVGIIEDRFSKTTQAYIKSQECG